MSTRLRRPLIAQGDAFWWGPTDILELTAPFAEFRRVVRGLLPCYRNVRCCRLCCDVMSDGCCSEHEQGTAGNDNEQKQDSCSDEQSEQEPIRPLWLAV